MASVAAAFIELRSPRFVANREDSSFVQRTSDVLEACKRPGWATEATRQEILNVALQLLQCRHSPVALQQLLLQLLRVLKRQLQPWSLYTSFEVIAALAPLFLNMNSAAEATVEFLTSLIIEIVDEKPSVEGVIQDAFQRWREQSDTRRSLVAARSRSWALKKIFDAEASVLRDGSVFEQLVVLKRLLMSERSVRERFVVGHRGAELIVHVLKHGSPLVKALARIFATDAAIYSHTFRAQMHGLWWQKHQQEWHLDVQDDLKLLVAISDKETLSKDEIMRALQHGEEFEQVIQLNALVDNDTLARRLSEDRNLLGALSSVLSRRSKMNIFTSSAADMRITSDLWALLFKLVYSDKPLQVTNNVFIGTQDVVRLALDVLTTTDCAPFMTLNALHVLRSSLLRTAAVRDIVIDSGALSSLVTMLAEQQDDSPLGRDLIALLRDLASFNVEFADEIDQVVLILCSSDLTGFFFQNLVLVYRDLPEVHLGRTTGESKAINAVTVARLLGTQGGDAEKLLMVHFLCRELRLRDLDKFDGDAVATAVAGNLNSFVSRTLNKAAKKSLTRLRGLRSKLVVGEDLLETEDKAEADCVAVSRTPEIEQVACKSSEDEEKAQLVEIAACGSDQEGDFRTTGRNNSVETAAEGKASETQDAFTELSLSADDSDWELI